MAMAKPCNCPRCRAAPRMQVPPLPLPRPSAAPRSHFAAYADKFVLATCGNGTVIPLRRHNSQGRYTCRHGVVTVPDDGYYMLLWELSIDRVKPIVQLQLGINDKGSMLCDALKPGHDSGQQVTWLRRGDKVSLQVSGNEQGELHGKHAQLTIIRLG